MILNMASKYFEMNCHVCRTLLIDPTEQTGENYRALEFLHHEVIKSLKIGHKIKDVYDQTRQSFCKRYAHMEQSLPSNFGFGTGYEFKESILSISQKNNNTVHEGNTFCVITSLKDLKREDGFVYSLQLTDTIIVRTNKTINLT